MAPCSMSCHVAVRMVLRFKSSRPRTCKETMQGYTTSLAAYVLIISVTGCCQWLLSSPMSARAYEVGAVRDYMASMC